MSILQPTYYTRHPDDTYSVADPQPTIQPVKQEPVACQFPRQPNNEGGWTIDAKFLNILVKDMADDEFAVDMEETEAVLLALERSYAEPVQPVKQEPVAWDLAEKVRRDLDRQSCPGVYMNIAVESIVKNYAAAIRGLK